MIAAKYEETMPPLIVDFLYLMDEVCGGRWLVIVRQQNVVFTFSA